MVWLAVKIIRPGFEPLSVAAMMARDPDPIKPGFIRRIGWSRRGQNGTLRRNTSSARLKTGPESL